MHIVVEALLVSVYLRGKDVYMYILLTTTSGNWLVLFEPPNSVIMWE
jgi:hypothetical protein